jgi:uncharacterized protein (TIGR02594 family)
MIRKLLFSAAAVVLVSAPSYAEPTKKPKKQPQQHAKVAPEHNPFINKCDFCFGGNSSDQSSGQYWAEEKKRMQVAFEQQNAPSKPVKKQTNVARKEPVQPKRQPIREVKCFLIFCREEEHYPNVERIAEEAKKWEGKHQKQNRQELKQLFAQTNVQADPIAIPWCAAFANAILARAGYETTGSLQARSFLHWGMKTKEPKQGDVVVLARGRDSWSGHVGFFEGFEEINGIKYVKVLGGNTEKAVQVGYYPVSKVLGYRTAIG